MTVVPLVSLVSVAVSVRYFGDHSACSAYGVLGVSIVVSMMFFGDCSATIEHLSETIKDTLQML